MKLDAPRASATTSFDVLPTIWIPLVLRSLAPRAQDSDDTSAQTPLGSDAFIESTRRHCPWILSRRDIGAKDAMGTAGVETLVARTLVARPLTLRSPRHGYTQSPASTRMHPPSSRRVPSAAPVAPRGSSWPQADGGEDGVEDGVDADGEVNAYTTRAHETGITLARAACHTLGALVQASRVHRVVPLPGDVAALDLRGSRPEEQQGQATWGWGREAARTTSSSLLLHGLFVTLVDAPCIRTVWGQALALHSCPRARSGHHPQPYSGLDAPAARARHILTRNDCLRTRDVVQSMSPIVRSMHIRWPSLAGRGVGLLLRRPPLDLLLHRSFLAGSVAE
ncbi:hypothetical protein C8R46DRAFT_1210525 [Mycena filopes]|nr:hypothetical protein C8R46DRAFT_1210525 [Mycena filopes]